MPARLGIIALALCAAAALTACDTGVAGDATGSANRAPTISQAVIEEMPDGGIGISANVSDLDDDRVTIDVDQRKGPDAAQRFIDYDGHDFHAFFDHNGDGEYEFRIRAHDGRSSTTVTVTIVIEHDAGPAPFPLPVYDAPVYQPGQYAIRVSGQVPADFGLTGFALNGTLKLEGFSPFFSRGGAPIPAITISTGPLNTLSPPGSLMFDTTTLINVDVDVEFVGRDIVILTGQRRFGPFGPGQFATNETDPLGPVQIASFFIQLSFEGETVNAVVLLSSFPTPIEQLFLVPEYDADFTGTLQ